MLLGFLGDSGIPGKQSFSMSWELTLRNGNGLEGVHRREEIWNIPQHLLISLGMWAEGKEKSQHAVC